MHHQPPLANHRKKNTLGLQCQHVTKLLSLRVFKCPHFKCECMLSYIASFTLRMFIELSPAIHQKQWLGENDNLKQILGKWNGICIGIFSK